MHLRTGDFRLWTGLALVTLLATGACTGIIGDDMTGSSSSSGGQAPGAGGGDAGTSADALAAGDGAMPGGQLADEQFPPDLLNPYTGPAITDYDNTFITFWQLRSRVARVFQDTAIGGDTNQYLADRIALFGGADFSTRYTENRVPTQDFLLALDGLAHDACDRASTNKTGPFTGSDPETAAEPALITQLYQSMLFRAPTAQEVTDAQQLLTDLGPVSPTKTSAWAGVCEALVRHPDSIFTLPPYYDQATGADKDRMRLVKFTNDLLGRPPSDAELAQLASKTPEDLVALLTAMPEFKDYFFHLTRVRMESTGTPDTDEPARLWTYLATSGESIDNLLTADFTVDANFAKAQRPTYHGKTGVLSMKGFIASKPGLPHYNYAARVFTDFMGMVFEVPQSIVDMRVNATASSTVQKGSICYTCHSLLTPFAHQRLKWADDGTYRGNTDDAGVPIDDTDRNLVDEYEYKGPGLESFSTVAIRKEKFNRQMFQALFLFYVGRQMRFDQDERTIYHDLWLAKFATNGDTRELLKVIAKSTAYPGGVK
jgi:hypothetical protein